MDSKNNAVMWVGGLIIAALISGVIGLQFSGSQQKERIEATDIGGIDVLRNDINNLRERLDALTGQTLGRPELDSRLEALAAQIETIEKTTNATIIRRFGEDVSVPIDAVREDAEKNEDAIVLVREKLARLEALVETTKE